MGRGRRDKSAVVSDNDPRIDWGALTSSGIYVAPEGVETKEVTLSVQASKKKDFVDAVLQNTVGVGEDGVIVSVGASEISKKKEVVVITISGPSATVERIIPVLHNLAFKRGLGALQRISG